MMSDISLNPAQLQPAVSDTAAPPVKSTFTAPTPASEPPSTTSPSDSVNLSPAAQFPATGQATAPSLNESDAVATSVGLRQTIGAGNLSVSAKQNQAILSLLR